LSFILTGVSYVYSQESEENFRYKNLLKATGTISPGFMLNYNQSPIYLGGELEYFVEDKVSLRGDAFWLAGTQNTKKLLEQNSSFMFGALYHFHQNRFDCFTGLQSGINITKPTSGTNDNSQYLTKVLPVVSPIVGITYYAPKYFNFFINARYVNSRYFGYGPTTNLYLDEIRICAGLGFNLNLCKRGNK